MPSRPTAALPAQRRNAARERTQQRKQHRRRPRVTRLLAWLLATWLGGSGWALAQVAPGALPTGGQVKVGAGQITQSGNLLVVQQNTSKLGLDWQSFNIGAGATVEFRQPGASSIALNRVLGNSGSEIYGQLKSNGQVFLTNPNGVLFAPGARVDVGGLVASTLDLAQQDFAEGKLHFSSRGGNGTVLNQGSLRANAGGYVALFGQQVVNQGDIAVDAGSVLLASGRAATVSISGSGLLSAVVTANTVPGSVDNSGRIVADGGVVTLTAKSAQDIAASLVNNSGIVRANTLVERGGEIWITGDKVATTGTLTASAPSSGDAGRILVLGDLKQGSAQLAGTLDASAAGGGHGGFVETSAAHVQIADSTRVSTAASRGAAGTWLIDPVDFTIAASGGDITGSALSANLGGGNVTILSSLGASGTAGNVNVNDSVSWAANKLTLNAQNNININAPLNGSGTASLALEYGQGALAANNASSVNVAAAVNLASGNNFSTRQGSDGGTLTYTVLTSLAELQALDGNTATLGGNYALGANIDASSTASGLGFNPIGNETTYTGAAGQYFSGRFDGLGHSISGLTVNRPTSNFTGLFASTRGATIRNLTLSGGAFSGSQYTGAITGYADLSTLITNVSSSAAVSSVDDASSGVYAGGLVGRFEGNASGVNGILSSSSSGNVLASTNTTVAFAGGIVGYVTRGQLEGLTASGTVSTGGTGSPSSFFAGGLIGINHSPGGVSASLASGNVSSTGVAGGLVGAFDGGGSIASSRATGDVSGGASVGGLVGRATGNVSGVAGVATATGTVSGTGYVGGLVGEVQTTGSTTDVRATGNVTGTATNGRVGGLIGSFSGNGSISNGRAEGTVSGALDVGGLVGYATGTGALSGGVALGSVTASLNTGSVGGLVGYYSLSGNLSGSDAHGNITGGANTGGLVGYYVATSTLSSSRGLGSTVNGGANYAGGLVGYSNAGAITGSSATAAVTGAGYAGGLVGRSAGSITGVAGVTTASGNVSGGSYVGGLVGSAEGTGSFTDVKATGTATASSSSGRVGGLIGSDTAGGISNGTALGAVSGGQYTGGLVGYFVNNGSLSNVRAEGNVGGTQDMGGLVGYASGSGALTDGVALGAVMSNSTNGNVGGLLGFANLTGGVTRGDAGGNVAGGNAAGGLVGYLASGGVTNSIARAGTVSANTYAGGLVGYGQSGGTVSGSSASAVVTSNNVAGGLMGQSGGPVSGSSATGAVTATYSAGGLVGQATGSGAFTDVQASGKVQGATAGGLVGVYSSSGAILRGHATGQVLASDTGGGLVGSHNGGAVTDSDASGSVTGVSDSTVYLGGLIGQYGASCYFCGNPSYVITRSWAAGAVRSDAAGSYLGGLVGLMYSGSIADSNTRSTSTVTATDSVNGTTNSNHTTGGLVGYFGYYNTGGTISGSNALGAVAGGYISGGLAGGFQGGSISDSSAQGTVSGIVYVGGLVGNGTHYAPVSNVSAFGAVTGTSASTAYVGGLYGQLSLQSGGLSNGFASGAVSGSSNGYAGGLVGYFNTGSSAALAINDSAATGKVTGGTYAGGLVGYYANSNGLSPLLNSHASGAVSGTTYAGGLVGGYYRSITTGAADDITNSYATGAVSGASYVGGLVGEFQGREGIVGSYATGNVLGTGSTGTVQLGGLVGAYYAYHTSTSVTAPLNTSYATGNVSLAGNATLGTSTNVYAGGLVGALDGALAAAGVTDSYATGAVTLNNQRGRLFAGGLVGFSNNQSLLRDYATGAVSATGGSTRASGGLLAGRNNTSTVATDSYWNTSSTGQASSLGGGTGLASAALLQAASFTNWSIASTAGANQTWRIYEGHTTPLLTRFLTPLALTLASASKTYDGNTSFGNAALSTAGGPVSFPDRIYTAAPSADVGSYNIAAAGVYSVQNGYDLSVSGSAVLAITPKTITLAGIVADKVYDGTRAATLLGTAQPFGLVAGEDLTVNLSGASALFDTKDAGQGKLVTITGLALANGSAGKASNYALASATSSSANISRATLSAGGFTATNRVYDGSTSVAVVAAGGPVTGRLGNDDVTVNLASVNSGSMADKNVGTGKAVTVLGASLTGADAGNYTLAGINAVTVDITPRALTVNGLVASDRQYDRTVNVNVSTNNATLSGAVGDDAVQLQRTNLTGTMADKNVAYTSGGQVTTKTVNVAGSGFRLRGADAANYSAQSSTTTVTIQPRTVFFYADRTNQTDRVYDGTTTAALRVYIDNFYSGDDLTLSYNAPAYSDKNVAYGTGGVVTSKTITTTGATLSGADAGNYAFYNTTSQTSGTITPKSLTVTGVSAVDRPYDGSINVTVNVSGAAVDTSGVVPGDVVTLPSLPTSGTVQGTIANKNVGLAKPVTVPGLALGGTDAGNYTLSGASGVTVNIAKKDLTVLYAAFDKVYDGNANALLSATSNDIVVGDTVRFYADQSYCGYNCGYGYFVTPTSTPTSYTLSKDAGPGKTVVVTGNGMYGTDNGNYNLLNPRATLSASITPKGITPVFTGVDKIYDGNTTASVNLNSSASGVLSGDAVSLTRNANFDTRNVGTNKTVRITDIAFTGASAANYTLTSSTASTTAAITPKSLSVLGVTATDRPYDGSTSVALVAGNVAAGGVVGSDVVNVVVPGAGLGNGSIANKNVGSNKPVTVSGLTLSGADAGNYLLDGGQGVTVNITPRPLTASFVGVDRVYNGGVSALVTGSSADLVLGDTLVYSQNAVFTGLDARNVGTNKPIGITGIVISGSDAVNYALLNTTASTTGSITPKTISVTYEGLSRVYNGLLDTSANVQGTASGLVAGDAITLAQTARFTGDGSAGVGKAVSVSNITLGGAQGGNYALLSGSASTTATVTPRPIGVVGVTATDRAYDGTRTVAVNTSGATTDLSGVIAGDQVSVLLPSGGITSGTVTTKDAGNNKDVTITGLTLSGASAANYMAAGATGLRVNITPRSLAALYSAASKVYDGTALASITASSADILAGDLLGLGITATGQFSAGKDAGLGKTVLVSGGFLTGLERNNYALLNPTGSTTADITRKLLTPGYVGGTRVYDGGVLAPVTFTTAGVIQGDVVGATQTAVFTGAGAKNVGSGKAVAVSNIVLTGTDKDNYALQSTSATSSASITPKPISIDGLTGAVATDRIYNGSRTVAVTVTTSGTLTPSSNDIVGNDQVQINLPSGGVTTGTMATKDAGFNKALVVDGLTLSGLDAINYSVAATSGVTVNIAQKSLTAQYSGVNKVYDGTTSASATGQSSDILQGDLVSISAQGVYTGGKNVGTGKAISVFNGSLGGSDGGNYRLLNPTGSTTASITRRSITPGYVGLSKVYDGTNSALVSSNTTGFIADDAVSLALGSAVFTAGKNVGTGKAIQISGITLQGADAGNYQLTGTTFATTGSITPKALRISGLTGVTAQDRAYDGSLNVNVTVSSSGPVAPNADDLVPGDVVTVTAPSSGSTTGTMLDKNVGQGKAVNVAGLSLGGADAINYSITATSGVTVNITPRPLTALYSAGSRVYDGSTGANITATAADAVFGDVLSITAQGVFTGPGAKNVGTGKAVAVSGATLAGADAANYSLVNSNGSTTGSITPKFVTATYVGGTRVYDGGTAAPVTGSTDDFIANDDVLLSQGTGFSAVFTGSGARNVGTGKLVAVSGIHLAGNDAGNYALTSTTGSTTGSITPRPVHIEGFTGVVATDRVYDGTLNVAISIQGVGTLTPSIGDIVAGDNVVVLPPPTGTTAGTMADKNVGTNKPVAVAGVTLSGTDAGNYSVAAAAGVTVNITPRPLTAVYATRDRVYDGTALIDVFGDSADRISGDALSITGSGLFTGLGAKNAGSGKAVVVTGGTLGGADAGNYSLLNPSGSTTGTITKKDLTPTYSGGTRVYDQGIGAPVTASTSGVIAGDDLQFLQTAEFIGAGARNVGDNKPVQVSNISLDGADSINYNLLSTRATTTASITRRSLDVSGLSGLTAVSRIYDGTLDVAITGTAVVNGASGNVLPNDDVSVVLAGGGITGGSMLDKNAGQGKAVRLNGLSLTGADAGNYAITGVVGLTVNIAPRPVQLLGLAALDRVYDGSTTVAINTAGSSINGTLAGDELTVLAVNATGTMADRHVGQGKAVTLRGVSLGGADAGNYTATSGNGLKVNITPRGLVAAGTTSDKVYDGSTTATVALAGVNVVDGDVVSLTSGSANFADKDAGSGKTVAVSGVRLAGADAGDYTLLSDTLSTTGTITRRPATVSAEALRKVYGDTLLFTGKEFKADNMVDGELVGLVTLASAGTASAADVGSGPYDISVGNARGGTFNPANYAFSYVGSALTVTPRPLSVTATTVVRYADAKDALNLQYSTNLGGLVASDQLGAVNIPAPPDDMLKLGGSIFKLVPSNATFSSGSAANYAISYVPGLLVVLSAPPRIGDNGGGGNQRFLVEFDEAERVAALAELGRTDSLLGSPNGSTPPAVPLTAVQRAAAPADVAVLLAGDGTRINLPTLLRLPLISFDPALRRPATPEPAAAGR